MSSAIFMAGYLVGAVSAGAVADRFGRKPTILGCSVVKVAGILLSIFGPNYAIYAVGQFVIGLAVAGCFGAGCVLIMELVGRNYRPRVGNALQISFSVGYMLLPAIAFGLRDEFWYQLVAFSPSFVIPFAIMSVYIFSAFILSPVVVLPVAGEGDGIKIGTKCPRSDTGPRGRFTAVCQGCRHDGPSVSAIRSNGGKEKNAGNESANEIAGS